MKDNNETFLREILEQMSTEQLDEMLQAELHKDPANGPAVRMILNVLRDREADDPVELTPEMEDAWENYKSSTAAPQRRPSWRGSRMLKAASTVLVLFVLISGLSQTAAAERFFGRLVRWTDSIFTVFDPSEEQPTDEYVFVTEHPGLQEVYDTLVELGVTEPVVPMWLPEGFVLKECKVQKTSIKSKLVAVFSNVENEIMFKCDVLDEGTSVEYHKDNTQISIVEIGGITHTVVRNKNLLVAVWARDGIECSISADCQEEDFQKILKSIYTVEDE